MVKKEKMKSFEDSLTKLKDIVEELENGAISLEESLSLYEEGVELIKSCHKRLNEAQNKVEVLIEDTQGRISKKDFSPEE